MPDAGAVAPPPSRRRTDAPAGTETLRSLSLVLIAVLALLIVTAPFIGGEPAEMVFAVATLGVPLALAGVALPRWTGRFVAGVVLIALLVLVESVGLTIIGLDALPHAGPGLPDSTLWMLFGLGLCPLVVVSVLYAWLHAPRGPRPGESSGPGDGSAR